MLETTPSETRIDPQLATRSEPPARRRRTAPSRDRPVRYREHVTDAGTRLSLRKNAGLLIGALTLWTTTFGLMWFSDMNLSNRIDDKVDGLRTELKADTRDLRTELKADISDVNVRIDDLRTELKAEIRDVNVRIDDLRTELKAEIRDVNVRIDDLRTELKTDISDLRTELKDDFQKVNDRLDDLFLLLADKVVLVPAGETGETDTGETNSS